ncbi:MAG TPA: epimerase [Candidatus Magasanikbacteria bacterium]|uniref:Nucleoside-diphosphate-sugar epimerase n=2 Tax=Candidatus Magasanikiibacteriota TaxID=1752731 RepID=A0A0G0VEY1_9BACT|nr:MAG: Nucleoside-diphosphate-sugar epimerase [Candidatus Magasanikbacteria bacterium GW2011_GWC2_41_17]HBV58335.1 epimerase [Candidatus Magasanikbacteria bacterium]HBX16193.1 epimerase [Candidatus Magasanikbacteria bacterium]
MNFLVTGGAGFLGINLIRYLLAKGHKITSLDIADFDYPEKNQVIVVKGDIRDKITVDKCMAGIDIVVHAAAALPLYTPEEIFSTDVLGTKLLLASALDFKVERFIHISSTAVYGIPDHHPLVETDKLDGVGPYGQAKIAAEEACVEYRKKGMCIPILRPKSFIGPERLGVFALFYDWAMTGHGFPMLGNGKNHYQLLDVEDLCEAIYFCVSLEKIKVNDTFNIGAADFTTMREDYQAVLNTAGFGKKIIGLPAAPAIWTLRILEKLRLSPLYKWVYETASKDSFVSIEKAKKILGFNPKYSNKQALLRNYKWYLENLHNFERQSGISHRAPWKQGILALAKFFF